ncbi:MAG: STAS domain-containing protein [Desulfovibrio sp.]|jgi:anti-anti-sigma regulatory factor|nr:STAS domain-containing protein [Desulfovibrio sp.]
MNKEIDASVLEGLADLFTISIGEAKSGSPYACRAFSAFSGERHTVFGRFHGRISLSNSTEFHLALYDLVGGGVEKVILDLRDAYLTRSTIGTLVAFSASMHGRNVRLYLYRPAPQIKAILAELNLISFYHFLETEDDIITALVI